MFDLVINLTCVARKDDGNLTMERSGVWQRCVHARGKVVTTELPLVEKA